MPLSAPWRQRQHRIEAVERLDGGLSSTQKIAACCGGLNTTTQASADQEILAGQAEAAKQLAAPKPEERKEISEEERQKLRDVKAALKAKPDEQTSCFYLTVIFKDGETRKKFLEQLKLPEIEQYVSGQTLMDVLFENATS